MGVIMKTSALLATLLAALFLTACGEKAAEAPDKEKMTKWIDDLSLPFIELKQNESNIIASDIKVILDSFKNWAKKQIETI